MQSVVIVNKVEIHVCKFVSTFVAMVMGATSRDFGTLQALLITMVKSYTNDTLILSALNLNS